jgi:hypothetical protein
MQKNLLLSLLLLMLLSGCISIGNYTACSVAGTLDAGMICAETITHNTHDMTLDETISFL